MPDHFLLYFESGGTRLTAESSAMLPKIFEAASKRPADMSVIGHTDTVGRAELNESLALKRANEVAAMLKDRGLKVYTH